MKKILITLLMLAAILATSTAWAQGVSKKYDLNAVDGNALAALSRVGAVETDLATATAKAEAEVRALKADLETVKASRSATAGTIRRANKALVAAQAKVAELEKQMAVTKAAEEASQKRLNTLMTGKPTEWNYLLPTEDPIIGLVRQKCPDGTVPEYVNFGANTRFECRPLIKASDLTVVPSHPTSKYLRCLMWGAVGGAVGGAGTYIVPKTFDNETTPAYVAAGTVLSAGLGYGTCVAFSE